MELKIIGSIFIIIGITGIGFCMTLKDKQRLNNLTDIKRDINMIMSELLYNKSLFYNTIDKLKNSSGQLSILYGEIIKSLDNNNSVALSWKFAFEKYKKELYIDNEESSVISGLGQVFSSPDYSYQKMEINSLIQYLDTRIETAEEKLKANSRLNRSIAMSLAAFVVVVLF